MLSLRVNRKFLLLFSVLALLMFAAAAWADSAPLYYGAVKKGEVATRQNGHGGTDIDVEEAIKALGYARTANMQGIVVTMSGKKMEFWNNSAVVRVNGAIVSFPYPIAFENDHWWGDSKYTLEVLNQFGNSVNRFSDVSLGTPGASAPQTAKAEPEPKQEVVAAPKNTEPKADVKTVQPKASQIEVQPEVSEPSVNIKMEGLPATPVFKGSKRPIVVLDAGHGGHDPGASGNGVIEKNINLSAVLQLGAVLKAYGVDVRFSRATDVYLKLAERTAFANQNKAAVFVSMHCNSMPKGKSSNGIEYYIMASPTDKDAMRLAIAENKEVSGGASTTDDVQRADKKTQLLLKILGDMQQNNKIGESTSLAESLYASARAAGLPLKHVRQAPFFVLRGAGMPAVLIEMGYLTDPAESHRLTTAEYRETLCRSFAQGIVQYIKDHPVVR